MPDPLFSIVDGVHTPTRYVKLIHKNTTPPTYDYTTDTQQVLEEIQVPAQADSDYCDIHFGERFHIVPTPKGT